MDRLTGDADPPPRDCLSRAWVIRALTMLRWNPDIETRRPGTITEPTDALPEEASPEESGGRGLAGERTRQREDDAALIRRFDPAVGLKQGL